MSSEQILYSLNCMTAAIACQQQQQAQALQQAQQQQEFVATQQAQHALLAQTLQAIGERGGNEQREKSLFKNKKVGTKQVPWACESKRYLGWTAQILAYFRWGTRGWISGCH